MYTFNHKNVIITCNSDLSGDCLIKKVDSKGNYIEKIEIPCSVFIEFLESQFKRKIISKIEEFNLFDKGDKYE